MSSVSVADVEELMTRFPVILSRSLFSDPSDAETNLFRMLMLPLRESRVVLPLPVLIPFVGHVAAILEFIRFRELIETRLSLAIPNCLSKYATIVKKTDAMGTLAKGRLFNSHKHAVQKEIVREWNERERQRNNLDEVALNIIDKTRMALHVGHLLRTSVMMDAEALVSKLTAISKSTTGEGDDKIVETILSECRCHLLSDSPYRCEKCGYSFASTIYWKNSGPRIPICACCCIVAHGTVVDPSGPTQIEAPFDTEEFFRILVEQLKAHPDRIGTYMKREQLDSIFAASIATVSRMSQEIPSTTTSTTATD
jgi:Zn finger protein HypA/HybF involved in hydrogenase expression